jgi:hypothetical protein
VIGREIDTDWIELPEPTPPPGGWLKPTCSFASHSWTLEIDEGRAYIQCADPCDPALFDPAAGNTPVCLVEWQPEDHCTPDPIPVRLVFVDDSTPSTPAGPAEWGYYIEVHAADERRKDVA